MENPNYIDTLRPSGDVIDGNRIKLPDKWQINVHRTLYNKGYGIQENSLAGVLTGYVAGLRSFEFDVLNTKDNRNVVFHDLVTNRVTGDYESPSAWVEKVEFGEVRNIPFNIVNVLSKNIKFQKTSQSVMPTTEEFLYFTHKILPAALDGGDDFRVSLYADARNDSPSSLIKLLSNGSPTSREYYNDHTVIKIYSFQYKSGALSLIKDYAEKYDLSFDDAKSAIADADANVLLIVSSALEADWSIVNDTTLSNFNRDLFERLKPRLPFSANSESGLNSFDGKTIFSEHDFRLIEEMTLKAAKFLIDFSAITNVQVYQRSLGQSLRSIIESNPSYLETREKFLEMGREKKILAAVNDNLVTILEGIHNNVFPSAFAVDLYTADGTKHFADHAPKPVWGLSDRFPDFILARTRSNGEPNNFPLYPVRNIYFAMTGGACEKSTGSDIKKRSFSSIYNKIKEIQNSGSSFPVSYITTDLDTDLMASLMGAIENPQALDDRYYTLVGNTIKNRFLPADIENFELPKWSSKPGVDPSAAACPVDNVERDEL